MPVDEIQSSIQKINRYVKRQDWEKALQAGADLLKQPAEDRLGDPEFRDQYVDALKKIGEIYTDIYGVLFSGAAVFKQVYEIAADRAAGPTRASDKEYAAYKLGSIYDAARLPQNAVYWYKTTLDLRRRWQTGEELLFNLYLVAWNYETLGDLEMARIYYDEILSISAKLDSLDEDVDWLLPAAMFQIHHADSERGEKLFQTLSDILFQSTEDPLPAWFIAALRALGNHYLKTQRPGEAIRLAKAVIKQAKRFEDLEKVRKIFYGLIARANLQMGKLDEALHDLGRVHEVNSPHMVFLMEGWVEIAELYADIARIHTAQGNLQYAMAAYETLVYYLGSLMFGENAKTSRKRFYWLQQQTIIVHEMVSVWLGIQQTKLRRDLEAEVANALLQLKANLSLSLEVTRLDAFKQEGWLDVAYFVANRGFANSAYQTLNHQLDDESMRELEEDLFFREYLEQQMVTEDALAIPGASRMLSFDFRESAEIRENIFLDYSRVDFCPPLNGLPGPVQGQRYIGVKLEGDHLQMVDLGEAGEIDPLCTDLIRQMSTLPVKSANGSDQDLGRNLQPPDFSGRGEFEDIDSLSRKVYARLIAPFESSGRSKLKRPLIISPDGVLAGLPFHALLHDEKYLIEEREVVYCHSLLQKESLSRRELSPDRRMVPSADRNAILLGDPDYEHTRYSHLPGTEAEVKEVGDLLSSHTFKDEKSFDDVKILIGPQATVSNLIEDRFPKIIHIAAHGDFSEAGFDVSAFRKPAPIGWYRWLEEMAVWPFSELDLALLRSVLVLSADNGLPFFPMEEVHELPEMHDEGRFLTALELSSLNLIGCRLVVLSACESGLGVAQPGAGVLGFQYALIATYARAGIVSLWKVLDRETSEFMVDFYQRYLDQRDAKAGYLGAMRSHCRDPRRRLHPYYWAAFSFLDLEYYYPIF